MRIFDLSNYEISFLRMRGLLKDAPGNIRARILGIYGILLLFNAGAWLWAAVAFHHYPVLLGTAFLAYGFVSGTLWMQTISPLLIM